MLKFEKTKFKGVYLIEAFSSEDSRGYFIKDFEKDLYLQNGLDINISESFESFSYQNVIRGLHFQTCNPQAKLVRAITGRILDVVVDLRYNSTTFGEWESFILSEENKTSIFIPKGFAHGFCVQSISSIVSYKCIGNYHKGSDGGIIWDDKDLSITWGIDNPIISERDKNLMSYKEFLSRYKALE